MSGCCTEAVALGTVLALAACAAPRFPEDAQPCPCADGWTCCPETSLCVHRPELCGTDRWSAPVDVENVPPYCGALEHMSLGREFSVVTRLTPRTYPFSVEKVVYLLSARSEPGIVCDPGIPHTVRLFRGDGAPPAEPVFERSLTAQATHFSGNRLVELDLDEPLIVERADVFVLFRLGKVGGKLLCVFACGSELRDRTWFSQAPAPPPYGWVDAQDDPGCVNAGNPAETCRQNLSVRVVGREWVVVPPPTGTARTADGGARP